MENNAWKPVPWIFFDLDDTIWNFSANSLLSLEKLYQISPILRKLFPDKKDFFDIYHANNYLMWDLYSKGEVTTSQLKLERWRRTLASRQFEVLTAVCEELERNYLDILAKEKEVFPGMSEMLARLSKRFMLAILSNGFTKTQYMKLHYSGLEKYITRTIVSEEIGINKPSPELFNYAVAETGALPPLLMVGDHPETDVIGAMKSGWYAILCNFHGKSTNITPEELVSTGIDPNLYIGEAKTVAELENLIEEFFERKGYSL